MSQDLPNEKKATELDILPLDFDEQLSLKGGLSDAYKEIRQAVKSAHKANKELWAKIFEFSAQSTLKENQQTVKNLCDRFGVSSYKSTEPIAIGLKLAIGRPEKVDGVNKLTYTGSVVTTYGAGFEFALKEHKCVNAEDYLRLVEQEFNGSLTALNARAKQWKAGDDDSYGDTNSLPPTIFDVLKDNAANLFGQKGVITASNKASGNYKLIVTNEDGKFKVTALEQLDDDAAQSEITSIAKRLPKDERPKSLYDCLKLALNIEKRPTKITLTVSGGKYKAAAKPEPDKDGNIETKAALEGHYIDADSDFNLVLTDKAKIKELKRCISILKSKDATWRYAPLKSGPIIEAKPIGEKTIQQLEEQHLGSKDQIKRLDPKIVGNNNCKIQIKLDGGKK